MSSKLIEWENVLRANKFYLNVNFELHIFSVFRQQIEWKIPFIIESVVCPVKTRHDDQFRSLHLNRNE